MWLTPCKSGWMLGISLQQIQHKTYIKLISPYSLDDKVPCHQSVDQWHLSKGRNFSKNRRDMKSSTHHLHQPWRLPCQGRNITKIHLSSTHTPLFLVLSLVTMHHRHIFLHVDWPSSSTIHYIFTTIIWYSKILHLLLSHAPQWGKQLGILIKHCSIFL